MKASNSSSLNKKHLNLPACRNPYAPENNQQTSVIGFSRKCHQERRWKLLCWRKIRENERQQSLVDHQVWVIQARVVGEGLVGLVSYGEGCGDWGSSIAMGDGPPPPDFWGKLWKATRKAAWNDDPWWNSAELEINIHTTANTMDHWHHQAVITIITR